MAASKTRTPVRLKHSRTKLLLAAAGIAVLAKAESIKPGHIRSGAFKRGSTSQTLRRNTVLKLLGVKGPTLLALLASACAAARPVE